MEETRRKSEPVECQISTRRKAKRERKRGNPHRLPQKRKNDEKRKYRKQVSED